MQNLIHIFIIYNLKKIRIKIKKRAFTLIINYQKHIYNNNNNHKTVLILYNYYY
jgi:hypothetical protein